MKSVNGVRASSSSNMNTSPSKSYSQRRHGHGQGLLSSPPFEKDGGVFSNGGRYDWRVINRELTEEERAFARANAPSRCLLEVLLI